MGIVGKLYRQWIRAFVGPQFHRFGDGTWINFPFRVDGRPGISIGEGTVFQRNLWLFAPPGVEGVVLTIGSNCTFGYNNHVAALRSVVIEDSVMTGNNVFISDNTHEYQDVNIPIRYQPVAFHRQVRVGAGSWIGENACILGASIGRNCVVGANSVVLGDIPDFCVVVGAPARIVKRFNSATHTWESVR